MIDFNVQFFSWLYIIVEVKTFFMEKMMQDAVP